MTSTQPVREAASSTAAEVLARYGLGARAFVYGLLGVLTAAIALGHSRREDDQQGALKLLAQNAWGKALLVLIAVGFAGYALWRLSEAAVGVAGEQGKSMPRWQSLFRGVVYAGLAYSTVQVLVSSGHTTSQTARQRSMSARLMQHTGGRFLLGIIGAVVVVVGLTMVADGVRQKFLRYLRVSDMSSAQRSVVVKTGTVGTCARGLVFALAGALVVQGAITRESGKVSGLDGALRTLSRQPYGQVLLLAAAAGLLAFAVYGFAEARWHKTL